jgi:magnesium chelatase family protein
MPTSPRGSLMPDDRCWMIMIAQASMPVTFPARLMLVRTMKPCPCSQRGHPEHSCTCTPLAVKKFLSRISSPPLDRINLQAKVPPVPYRNLASTSAEESSVMIRTRMNAARARQQQRYRTDGLFRNAHMLAQYLRSTVG